MEKLESTVKLLRWALLASFFIGVVAAAMAVFALVESYEAQDMATGLSTMHANAARIQALEEEDRLYDGALDTLADTLDALDERVEEVVVNTTADAIYFGEDVAEIRDRLEAIEGHHDPSTAMEASAYEVSRDDLTACVMERVISLVATHGNNPLYQEAISELYLEDLEEGFDELSDEELALTGIIFGCWPATALDGK